ncbi:MAG: FAD:protein FMN transferase [Chlorobi bacterium]|nr:FAD:protein FMN transferase [Chlorobiota bacterium]
MRVVYLLLLFLAMGSAEAQDRLFTRRLLLMGSAFEIMVTDDDSLSAQAHIDAAVNEIKRIEKLISSWDPDSETSRINRMAGIRPVKVSDELFSLIARSLAISRITDGAFDITFASMDKIWRFDGSMKTKPSPEEVARSVRLVGYENVVLDSVRKTVFLKHKGMKIGFGGIGKGYAADKAKQLLISRGVKGGIINASGDMNVWGTTPDGRPWTVAIVNPFNKKTAFATVPMRDGAVATSGDYEKYVMFDGVRYAHIINPKTGWPVTGTVSVTVFAPTAELADALATAVFVMGIEAGIDRVNQLPGIEAVIVDEEGKVHTSAGISIQTDKIDKNE